MINIAVVIVVSDYGSAQNDLPACSRDGSAIEQVLRASGRFSDVLYIHENTNSTSVKTRLSEFVKKYHGQEVGEIFYYFSGHGDFSENEFYYLLSDYSPRHRNRTSLSVVEVDDLIRPLSPNLFVKVVDACHSGRPYIKSRDEIDDYLKSGNSKFKNLYFFFSSQTDQFSYQDDTISYFTESILKAVYEHSADSIRYADIASYVSDDFRANSAQTPYFINQADFTEVFIDNISRVRPIITEYIKNEFLRDENVEVENPKSDTVLLSMTSKIKEDAKLFCTEQDAKEIYEGFPANFDRQFLSPEFVDLYAREVTTVNHAVPNMAQIGVWLDKNRDVSSYFAVPATKQETYQKRVDPYSLGNTLALLGHRAQEEKFVSAIRTVISGFDVTTTVPYEAISIKLISNLPNLTNEVCYVVPIISRTSVRFFWAYVHYKYKDWNKQVYSSNADWLTEEAFLREGEKIKAISNRILEGFSAFVEEPIRAKWGV